MSLRHTLTILSLAVAAGGGLQAQSELPALAPDVELPQNIDILQHGPRGEWILVDGSRAPRDDLVIVAAHWGASDGWTDVTSKLRDQVQDGRLHLPDLNTVLADVEDPKFGHGKALVVVYQHQGQTRVAIVGSTPPTGRGGTLMLPEKEAQPADAQAFHKRLVGTQWRIEKNSLTLFFEDGKYGVSDWGDRRGIWMATGPNRVGAVAYDGSHNDLVFDHSLATGTLLVDGQRFSKLTRLPSDRGPTIEPLAGVLKGPLFECVLGVYGHAIRGPRVPLVNLRPPNRNLWTKNIEEQLKGTLSYEEVDYIGTAKLVIPEKGVYTVDVPRGTQFRLNGQLVEAGDLTLRKGVYDVEIYTNHWGQPHLKYAHAAVVRKDTQTRIPLVNTGDAVESFMSQDIDGRFVTEVSGHHVKEVHLPSDDKR